MLLVMSLVPLFLLILFHLGKIHVDDDQKDEEHQSQESIIIKRDRPDKQRESVNLASLWKRGAHSRSPAGDWGNDTDRRCGGVDHIRKLGPRDLIFVCDWLHDGSNRQTVEIIVHEDHSSKKRRGKHGLSL